MSFIFFLATKKLLCTSESRRKEWRREATKTTWRKTEMWSWTQLTNWEMEIKDKPYSRHLSRRQNMHSLHLASKANRHVCEKEGNSRRTLYKVQYSPENSIFSSSFRVLNFYRNRMFQCEREKQKKLFVYERRNDLRQDYWTRS